MLFVVKSHVGLCIFSAVIMCMIAVCNVPSGLEVMYVTTVEGMQCE